MPRRNLLKSLIPDKFKGMIREQFARTQVSHILGPKMVQIAKDEAVVTCVVKNGEFYAESFINHYFEMGFRHIFFLDNGSTDETISIAKKYNNVSVCRSTLPIEPHQGIFKRYLARKIFGGGWCLDADIDELFDYQSSEARGLRPFLQYLNQEQYTAVITQLLDMFSEKPLSSLGNMKQEKNLKKEYAYYDISDVKRENYQLSKLGARFGSKNNISNENTQLIFGGIRKTLYGNDCLLTKHSLFLPGQGLDLFPHVHFVNNAKLADISCIMLHYKVTSNALETASQNKEAFRGNSKGYNDFSEFILKGKDDQIKRNSAVKFQSVNDLIESGFLFTSAKYRKYVNKEQL